MEGLAFDLAEDVLEQERHSAEGPVGKPGPGLFADAFEAAQDHGVELRVEPLDAGDGSVDQLQGRNLPIAHQFRLCRRVQASHVVHGSHYIEVRRVRDRVNE